MTDDALDRILERMTSLSDVDRRALIRLFGAMYEPRELPSPALCDALREIGSLDDEGIAFVAGWFQDNVNLWGVVVGEEPSSTRVRFSKRRLPTAPPPTAPARVQHQIGALRKAK